MAEPYEKGYIRTDRGLFIDKGNQVFDVRHPDFGKGGAKGDGVTDDAPAFNAAIDAAEEVGGIVVVPPTAAGYRLGSQVTIAEPITFDARGAYLIVDHAGHGVVCERTSGNGSFGNDTDKRRLRVEIGAIRRINNLATQDADSTGLKVVNSYYGHFDVGSTQGFRRGRHFLGTTSGTIPKGCVYNTIHLGESLDHVGLRMSADTGGWCNANTLLGGRFYGATGTGGADADLTHIHLENEATGSGVSTNTFIGFTLEGVGRKGILNEGGKLNCFLHGYYEMSSALIVDYIIDIQSGNQNKFLFGRGLSDVVADGHFNDLGLYNVMEYEDTRDGLVHYQGGASSPAYDAATRTGSGKWRTLNRTGTTTQMFNEWYTAGLDGEVLSTQVYSGTPIAMSLSGSRRVRLRCTADLASGGLVLSNPPTNPCLIEVSIEQNGGARTVSSTFLSGLRWGHHPRPVPLSGAEDVYLIRVISASSSEVVAHSRRAGATGLRTDITTAPARPGEIALSGGQLYMADGTASSANWRQIT